MENVTSKTPADTAVTTRYLVMPDQANPAGTVFGGVILSWIDMVASMSAQRHCRSRCVTVSIDSVSFSSPIHIGEHVILKSCVNYTGRTSMEVGVLVLSEHPLTGKQTRATTAHLTFVALDENKKPTLVPQIVPETEVEIRRFKAAKLRAENRKKMRHQN